MGRPIMHFEIASPNLERAAAHQELFDWDVGAEQMDGYRLVETTDGSIGGGMLRPPEGVFPYVTIYVGVEDLAETLKRAEELGGKTVVEPMPIPGAGMFAMFQDPDGVLLGLFEETPKPGESNTSTAR